MRKMYSEAYILELINKGISSADYASANTQLNGLCINGTNYKLLDVKVNDGSSLIIGKNRSLASNASKAVAIGDCDSAMVSGDSSTALGYSSKASGGVSTALGNFSTASGFSSIALGDSSVASGLSSIAIGRLSTASGSSSTALGQQAAVYIPNWVGFDGTTDDYVRTLALKSTDNVYFRNENVNVSKTTQASYTSGKTLTQVLSEKQDTLVAGTGITKTGNTLSVSIPVYIQDAAPTIASGSFALWIDSAHSYIIKVYTGSAWVNTSVG